jgi:hypothetical protein
MQKRSNRSQVDSVRSELLAVSQRIQSNAQSSDRVMAGGIEEMAGAAQSTLDPPHLVIQPFDENGRRIDPAPRAPGTPAAKIVKFAGGPCVRFAGILDDATVAGILQRGSVGVREARSLDVAALELEGRKVAFFEREALLTAIAEQNTSLACLSRAFDGDHIGWTLLRAFAPPLLAYAFLFAAYLVFGWVTRGSNDHPVSTP